MDGERLPTGRWPRLDRFKEHTIELPVGIVTVSPAREPALRTALQRALDFGKGVAHVLDRGKVRVFSTRRACPSCGRSFAEPDPRLFSYNSKHGWCETCFGTGVRIKGFDAEQSGEEIWWNDWFEGEAVACPSCDGQRLNPVALSVTFRRQSIAQLSALPVDDALGFFTKLQLQGREAEIARDLSAEILSRLSFLRDVGLGYIALDRAAPTLSGGEAQRIRLASQLGSNLRGVCYVLDEPTIGLHPRDNRVLLDALGMLSRKGNTLLVVEHDEDTIRRADHVIDLGPGAGTRGGRVVGAGRIADLIAAPESLTGRFLQHPLRHPLGARRAVSTHGPALEVRDATLHNLRKVNARIPLGRLTVVTGVSGSGKSTLARDVLYTNLRVRLGAKRGRRQPEFVGCRSIDGWQSLARVLEVDQTPIGKTPRSCPATYVGFWDEIRKLFAGATEARVRGYTASRFSFNTPGGRCESCEGQGVQTIEMSFLPDVKVLVRHLWRAALQCRDAVDHVSRAQRRRRAGDERRRCGRVLRRALEDPPCAHAAAGRGSRVPHARPAEPDALRRRSPAHQARDRTRPPAARQGAIAAQGGRKAGGGCRASTKQTLYVLDEPTVGLHMADVEKLLRVLHRLVDAGNTVVVIEHNLDVIAEADWLLDLGPEGGSGGGRVVAKGSPEAVAAARKGSHTAAVLAGFLAERGHA